MIGTISSITRAYFHEAVESGWIRNCVGLMIAPNKSETQEMPWLSILGSGRMHAASALPSVLGTVSHGAGPWNRPRGKEPRTSVSSPHRPQAREYKCLQATSVSSLQSWGWIPGCMTKKLSCPAPIEFLIHRIFEHFKKGCFMQLTFGVILVFLAIN